MSTPEPTKPKSPTLLEKMQYITKKVMGLALFVDPLDKTNENYKTFRKRQKGIALYAANLEQISKAHAKKVEMDLKRIADFKATVEAFEKAEKDHPIPEEIKQKYESWKKEEEAALSKIPEEMNQYNEAKKKAEKALRKNNTVYKTILAQEEDRFKTKESKIRDRIKILERIEEENRTPDQKKELAGLQAKDNSVLKTHKSKTDTVNQAIVIADSRITKLIAKNELHASVQTTVIRNIPSENLQPEDKLALKYAVEYSIGQLEGVGTLLLRGLKKKCIASGWVEDTPGNLVYEKPPNSLKFEISTILTSTYNAYVTTGLEKYTLGMSSATKTRLLEDAGIITTPKPVQPKEPVMPVEAEHPPILRPEPATSTRKPPTVDNPLVIMPEFAAFLKDSKNPKSVTLTPVDTPTVTAVDTPITSTITPTKPPISTPSAKLEPAFKHFCDAVVDNYNKRTNQKVDVEEEKNKMKITTPPPWEIRKTTAANSEITIPHDDGTTAAQHVILSAIQAAAAAHRPVRIDLQDPKQIEFAIEETKKLPDVKYVLTPKAKEILNEERAKDPNVKKGAHP